MRFRRRPTASAWLLGALLVLLLLRLASNPRGPANDVFQTGQWHNVKRVVDGDTLLLDGGERLRLIGIDTPETKRPEWPVEKFGPEASEFTASLVGQGRVRLEFDLERRDEYHRLLAYVYLPDGRLLNEEIIRAGFSKAATHFPFRNDMKQRFRAAEEQARAERRGIWSDDVP